MTGILYGLSWPIFDGVNLSFLAWFAFVPLFIFLEQHKEKFLKSMLGCYAAMVVFGCFSAGWVFNFPISNYKIALIFFLGELWFFMPFLFFYPIQRKIGFQKSIWFFPLIWMLWEWLYLPLEFTMGTHLSPYSQSSNLWLIQFIDATGMWGISCWLLLFNVLIYKAYTKANNNFRSKIFYKNIAVISLLMLGIPLLYSFISFKKYNQLKGKKIDVTIVPTRFSARFLDNPNNMYEVVEQTLKRTDIDAFAKKSQQQLSDLYVWPETGLPYTLQQTNLSDLLFEAVNDWESALLTGGRGIVDTTTVKDLRTYVSGVLISHKNSKPKYHHKTVLTPGQEAIPYHSILAKIPNFPIAENDETYFKKGEKSEPLQLITKNNTKYLLGVSLCYEQWYPQHWATLAVNGAEFYTHLAAEGWYGNVGFKKFMANVTRMRCIENRKQAARSANVGLSGFIDQIGRFQNISNINQLKISNATITTSNVVTMYAKNPHWFPYLGLCALVILLGIQFYNCQFYYLLK